MGRAPSARSAYLALAVLTAMNLLNYLDRFILAAVIGPVQTELGFQDAAGGFLTSVFFISYAACSPAVGWLGDRVTRKYLLALGVGLWSLATFASGWVQSYEQMIVARSFLGVGEAAYAILAPTLIGDLFPRSQRNRALTIFYLAIPLGAALGYVIGGRVEAWQGWRMAFQVVGGPGLLVALGALLLPEPPRGSMELAEEGDGVGHGTPPLSLAIYLTLARNRSYVLNTLGMAMMTFALGGLQVWVAKYLSTGEGAPELSDATDRLGIAVVLSSLVGVPLGGILADRLAKVWQGAYFWVCGLGMLASAPFVLLALLADSNWFIYGGIFLGLTLAVFNLGPSNTINVNVTVPGIRAAAIAVNLFLIHLLGDIPSPYIMGAVSDATRRAGIAADAKEGLFWGLAVTLPALLLSGLFFCLGARYLKGDQDAVLRQVRGD